MTNLTNPDEISLLDVATVLLRSWRRIVAMMLAFAVLAGLTVLGRQSLFRASASFVPQGGDQVRSGLASLATQFGVSLPSGTNPSASPEFYSALLRSRVLLTPIVQDTFTVAEHAGARVTFFDLFEIPPGSPAFRTERAVKFLSGAVDVSIDKLTGVEEVTVDTPWPSVSLDIVSRLLQGLNDYNRRTRQGQAAAERKFIEGRLAEAAVQLRLAEDRMQVFQQTNRQFVSPELSVQRDRIRRELDLRQQTYTTLSQAYEDARIREVRDTPVISIFEPPYVPTHAQPRGRLKRVLLGMALGGFIAVIGVLFGDAMARRRREGDADALRFLSAARELRMDVMSPLRGFRRSKAGVE